MAANSPKAKLRRPNRRAARLRHAAASELLEEGTPLSVVQRQLRHRDAPTTLQKYGHVVGDAQRRTVDNLAKKIERHVAIKLETSGEMEPKVA
jgi:integrase